MVAVCNLSDVVSWFACAEAGVPFTEMLSISIFFVLFLLLKEYPLREALPPALFISTFVSAGFLAMGVMTFLPYLPVIGIILTAFSVVLLFLTNP